MLPPMQRTMTTRRQLLLALALTCAAPAFVACGEERAAPAPNATPAAPTTPTTPTLTTATLPAPSSARVTLGVPMRILRSPAEGHDVRTWPAKFGSGAEAAQLQFGVRDSQERATLAFYGHGLTPGRYEVLPGTDETVAAHAGKDSRIFTLELRLPGHDVRSVSGSVTITAVDERHIAGELEVRVQDRERAQPEAVPVVARFDAAYDSYIGAWIENESEVRAQLRARSKRAH
jgi:hypothetical protein